MDQSIERIIDESIRKHIVPLAIIRTVEDYWLLKSKLTEPLPIKSDSNLVWGNYKRRIIKIKNELAYIREWLMTVGHSWLDLIGMNVSQDKLCQALTDYKVYKLLCNRLDWIEEQDAKETG